MSRPEEFNDLQGKDVENNKISDPYRSETSFDIYNTPDVSGEQENQEDAGQEEPAGPVNRENAEEAEDSAGMTEPEVPENPEEPADMGAVPDVVQTQDDVPDPGSPYLDSPYGNQNQQYQGGSPYSDSPYGNQNQQAQGSSPYSDSPYGNQNQQTYGGNAYNNGQYDQSAYTGNAYNNHPYSPYAAPAKKNNVKLIIGIVAGIIILFLIAVFALTYKVVSLYSEARDRSRHSFEEYEFEDDREANRERRREENDADSYDDGYDQYGGYFDDYYDDYGYGDYDDYDYDDYYDYDSDPYYTLHDDIRYDLSYSVDFEYYEYDTDDEDVEIMVTYPVITGENIPNLEHINDVIAEEIDLFKDYFEEEYASYMDDDDSYFSAISSGYVTYMDEEKLSIVFSEYIYTDYYNEAFLYSINVDMENGVILDNENMLSVDDEFSVEFRTRSDAQNGEITYLTAMTDQEITDYFNSSNIIVFYTPKGMEIGFNYEEGWVTVTYEEYEQYLKVF